MYIIFVCLWILDYVIEKYVSIYFVKCAIKNFYLFLFFFDRFNQKLFHIIVYQLLNGNDVSKNVFCRKHSFAINCNFILNFYQK